jgi:hypothetical protein
MNVQNVFKIFSFTNYRRTLVAVTSIVHSYVLKVPTYVRMDEAVLKLGGYCIS